MSNDGAILPSSDGHHDRADLALIRRAIREGWDIKPEWKRSLPQRMARIVADPASKNRDAIGAFQALRMAEADQFGRLVELHKLEAGQTGDTPSASVTVNVGIVAAPQVLALAMDPEKFDQFAQLAESIQSQKPANNGAATPNGSHHNGHRNGTVT